MAVPLHLLTSLLFFSAVKVLEVLRQAEQPVLDSRATEVQQIMEELGKIADDEGSADGLKNFIR